MPELITNVNTATALSIRAARDLRIIRKELESGSPDTDRLFNALSGNKYTINIVSHGTERNRL